MNDKYIIRNCPALVGCRVEQDLCYKNELHKCQDCTDCVLKQIVEKCKFWIDAEKNNRYKTNGWILSDDILRLLNIQDVE